MSDVEALRQWALGFPEALADFPWGEWVAKVRGKIFVFLNATEAGVSVTLKLRASHGAASLMPFVRPTGYGLGRSGWITARFSPHEALPIGILSAWIDESYGLIAPKSLVKQRGRPAQTA